MGRCGFPSVTVNLTRYNAICCAVPLEWLYAEPRCGYLRCTEVAFRLARVESVGPPRFGRTVANRTVTYSLGVDHAEDIRCAKAG